MRNIKLFVMDVDGTLTDGKIYIGNKGELFKAFCVKDGLGIRLLKEHGIIPVIITARISDIVICRAAELEVFEVYQGYKNKTEALNEVCAKYSLSYNEIAVIGDDVSDLPMIELAGLSFAPSNCHKSIKQKVDYICECSGGNGAVREAIDYILINHPIIG